VPPSTPNSTPNNASPDRASSAGSRSGERASGERASDERASGERASGERASKGETSDAHAAYLRQRFTPRCSLKVFDAAEKTALKRYGHWLQALAAGAIQPETEAQARFVDLAGRDDRPAPDGPPAPEDDRALFFADLWWRYERRLAWERGEG
jgi:hypothetical protein